MSNRFKLKAERDAKRETRDRGNRLKKLSTLVVEHEAGSVFASDRSLWAQINREEILSEPLVLATGDALPPGTLFSRIAGKKTSAGFTQIALLEGHALRYLGKHDLGRRRNLKTDAFDGDSFRLAVFEQAGVSEIGKADRLVERSETLLPSFYVSSAESTGKQDHLLFFTAANAGRIVETDDCVFHRPEGGL